MNLVDCAELIITPYAINTDKHFYGAFGNSETEVSAKHIVKLAQKKEGWYPFTLEEIEAQYNETGHKYFCFNELLSRDFIIKKEDKYYFTSEFISRVFMISRK